MFQRFMDMIIKRAQSRAVLEGVRYKTRWQIEKYANDEDFAAGRPFGVSAFDGNILLNEGINYLWQLVAGVGGLTAFNNANARLQVGSSNVAEDPSQVGLTTLLGSKGMDGGYPQAGSSQKVVFRSTFGGADANGDWNEFSVDNGAGAAVNLNRKVSTQGTKVAGQTWVLTLEVSLS